jgi:hypothetical protein
MEMCHNNARLPLRIKADAPSFVTKERRALERSSPFTQVIKDALTECVSRFCHKSRCVFDLK